MPEITVKRHYFEPGTSLHTFAPGQEMRIPALLRSRFNVGVISRDNWLELSGAEQDVKAALDFLASLCRLYRLRNCQLDLRDIELLARNSAGVGNPDLELLWNGRVQVSPKKRDVLARSKRQLDYINAIRKHDVTFGIGPAGTGKTYLAMALAVSAFLRQEVSRIVLTRPARESGERLGFLPGSLEEKVSPYLRPLYDALHEMLSPDEAADLIGRGVVEIAPLAFMRGRTLNDAVVILDEAQNTTTQQIKMFLTRMGMNTKMIVTGDMTQIDLPSSQKSGLVQALHILKGVKGISFIELNKKDIVRHKLVTRIVEAYEKFEEKQKEEKNK